MRRLIRTIAIAGLFWLGILAGRARKNAPKPSMAGPATHYHGYELNRLAINRAKSFTVLISVEGFGGVGRGTGVLIDSTHVITCAHMVEGPHDDMWIYPYGTGTYVKGKPVAVRENIDLAILELDKPIILPHYAVFQDMHYDGEPITIIGNTLGAMRWFVSFGIVSGSWEEFILTDGVLYGGNSGGPWINEQGEIIALTDWTLLSHGAESGIHGGIPASTIHAFLREYKSPNIGQILQMILGTKKGLDKSVKVM